MKYSVLIAIVCLHSAGSLNAANTFVVAGWPAPDRDWYGAEYKKVADILGGGQTPLPAIDGADGQKIFERMVDTTNFRFVENKTISIEQRMPDFMELQASANAILKLYVAKANGGAKLHQEVARLFAFLIRSETVMLDLVDEYIPSMPHDATLATRLDGLKKVKMGAALLFSSAEESLGERSFYSAPDIVELLDAMHAVSARLNSTFSGDFRFEMQTRLKKRLAEAKIAGEADRLKAILNDLSNHSPEPTPSAVH